MTLLSWNANAGEKFAISCNSGSVKLLRYSKQRVISSSGMPVTFVVHVSPALTGIASVNVPVEMTSPACSGGLYESFSSSSIRCRSARRGLSSTRAPLPRSEFGDG
jgi:hypothetical protein